MTITTRLVLFMLLKAHFWKRFIPLAQIVSTTISLMLSASRPLQTKRLIQPLRPTLLFLRQAHVLSTQVTSPSSLMTLVITVLKIILIMIAALCTYITSPFFFVMATTHKMLSARIANFLFTQACKRQSSS